MAIMQKIPTSADIYLEVDGKKVAVVQSYRVTTSRGAKAVSAFGQSEPVATIRGESLYILELSRLYATGIALKDGIDFYELDDFSLVICKPDRKIIYADCQWSKLEERAEVGGTVLEHVTVTATRRHEVKL